MATQTTETPIETKYVSSQTIPEGVVEIAIKCDIVSCKFQQLE